MWDAIKGFVITACFLVASVVVAAFTATLGFVAGWTNGIVHMLNDLGVAPTETLVAHRTDIYIITFVLIVLMVLATVKIMEKLEADGLWVVAIMGLALVVAGPAIYTSVVHHGMPIL